MSSKGITIIDFISVEAVVPVTYSLDTVSFTRKATDVKNDNDKGTDTLFLLANSSVLFLKDQYI